MKRATRVFPLLLALVWAALTAAQEAPQPPSAPGKPPDARRRNQPPPPLNDADFFRMQTLQAIEGKADLLLDMGKLDAAIEELRKVSAMDISKDSPVYEIKIHLMGRLAMAYADAGRKAEALETGKKVLAEVPPGSPAEAEAWLEAGSVYKKLGMPDEALQAFDRAIALSQKLAQTPPQGGPRPGPWNRPPR
jgi:tetratricopeptide (TPR) repeat protein